MLPAMKYASAYIPVMTSSIELQHSPRQWLRCFWCRLFSIGAIPVLSIVSRLPVWQPERGQKMNERPQPMQSAFWIRLFPEPYDKGAQGHDESDNRDNITRHIAGQDIDDIL